MQISVNFLNLHRKKLSNLEASDRKYYRIILSIAIGAVVIGCVALAANIFLQYSTSQLLTEKNSLESKILQQENLEESALILSSKLQIINQLISQRSDKQEAITYFTELFGPDVFIKDIDYEADGGILSLRLESETIFAFNRVVDLLENQVTLGRFSSLTKSDLARGRTGTYALTVTVTLSQPQQETRK